MIRYLKKIFTASNCFALTVLSILFGSSLFPFKVSFFTLNLGMVLSPVLLSFFLWKNGVKKIDVLFSLPIVFLGVYSSIQLSYVESLEWGLQEVRSLLLMCLSTLLFIQASRYFGLSKFTSILIQLLWLIFVFLIIFGFFEFFTGVHLWKEGVEKLIYTKDLDSVFAARFIWDNPNNYISAILVFSSAILLFDVSVKTNLVKQLFILFCLLFFSDLAWSKYGILCTALFSIVLVYLNRTNIREKLSFNGKYLKVLLSLVLLFVLTNKWFEGKTFHYMFNTETSVNTKSTLTAVNKKKSTTIKEPLKKSEVVPNLSSTDIRKNLILNGVHYFSMSPILGIGPGQYQYNNIKERNKYPINTVKGSHHFFVDVFSQYGLVGLFFIITYIVLVIINLVKAVNWEERWIILMALIFFFVAGNLPSKFSSFEFAHIGIALVTLFLYQNYRERNENRI